MGHLPSPAVPPEAKVAVGRFPRRQITRHRSPLTPVAHEVENRVDDFPATMARRVSTGLDSEDERHQEFPFSVTQIDRSDSACRVVTVSCHRSTASTCLSRQVPVGYNPAYIKSTLNSAIRFLLSRVNQRSLDLVPRSGERESTLAGDGAGVAAPLH